MSWGLLQVTTMFFVSDIVWQCWTMVIMVWYGKRLLWRLFLWLIYIYIYSCCYHYHDNGKFIGKHTVNYYNWLCVCVCFTINGNTYGKHGDTYQMVSHTHIYIYGMVRYPLVHGPQRVHHLYQIWAESEQLLHASPVWISFYILHTHQRTLNSHSFSFHSHAFFGYICKDTRKKLGLKTLISRNKNPLKHPSIVGHLWKLPIQSLNSWGLEVLEELVHPYIRGLVRGPGCRCPIHLSKMATGNKTFSVEKSSAYLRLPLF